MIQRYVVRAVERLRVFFLGCVERPLAAGGCNSRGKQRKGGAGEEGSCDHPPAAVPVGWGGREEVGATLTDRAYRGLQGEGVWGKRRAGEGCLAHAAR